MFTDPVFDFSINFFGDHLFISGRRPDPVQPDEILKGKPGDELVVIPPAQAAGKSFPHQIRKVQYCLSPVL